MRCVLNDKTFHRGNWIVTEHQLGKVPKLKLFFTILLLLLFGGIVTLFFCSFYVVLLSLVRQIETDVASTHVNWISCPIHTEHHHTTHCVLVSNNV